jgi:peptide deformylase
MIHPIVKYGDAVLETPGKRVEKFDDDLQNLVADMFESMYAAAGVGLAAPQIGVGLRLTVIDVSNGKIPEAKMVLANPEIIYAEGQQREEEGCLSTSPSARKMPPEIPSNAAAKDCSRAPSATRLTILTASSSSPTSAC